MSSTLKLLASTAITLAMTIMPMGTAKAEIPTGYVQLANPVLACDTKEQLQTLVDARLKSMDDFKKAYLALHAQPDQFNEPSCMYDTIGPVAFGDKTEDKVDVGVQKPEGFDYPTHVYMLHVGNSQTDFWLLWWEKVVNPVSCTVMDGCI